MCFHDKPTRNDQEKGYLDPEGIPWQAPPIGDKDELLFDECGRCSPQVNGTGSTDYHSHHFRVVQNLNRIELLVRHGGGDARITIGYRFTRIAEILDRLDSDARYLMLHALYDVHREAVRETRMAESDRWMRAAIDKRIKTKKVRGLDRVNVWIEERKPEQKA